MTGFWIMALGAFLFIVAALYRAYPGFLLGLFAIGAGLAILQTAANPYITVLGARDRAAQRISIMGVANKTAGILAQNFEKASFLAFSRPFPSLCSGMFAAVVLRPTDSALFRSLPAMGVGERNMALDGLIRRVMVPYACVGGVLLVLGWMVRYSSLPEIDTEQEDAALTSANAIKTSVFHFPHLVLGALAIFLHVGTQVLAIDTIIGYAGSMKMTLSEAKVFPSYTLLATIVGYVTGIICIPRWISQARAFLICTMLGISLSLLIVLCRAMLVFGGHTADISLWFLVLLGFANSLIWAGIWPLALDGLGRFTKAGASLLVMGLCGNAILPLIYGWIADRAGLREGYWVLLPCYSYLFFYALYGHRIRKWGIFKLKHIP